MHNKTYNGPQGPLIGVVSGQISDRMGVIEASRGCLHKNRACLRIIKPVNQFCFLVCKL